MDIHKHLATGLWGADGFRTASAEKDGSLVTGTPLTNTYSIPQPGFQRSQRRFRHIAAYFGVTPRAVWKQSGSIALVSDSVVKAKVMVARGGIEPPTR